MRDIFTFISEHNPSAAEQLEKLILDGAERAAALPYAYRSGRVPGTRELIVHPNYILVFQVMPARVRMLRVLHARRHYP